MTKPAAPYRNAASEPCEFKDAVTTDATPEPARFSKGIYDSAMADAADLPGVGGHDIPPEEAYAMALEFAKKLERERNRLREALATAGGEGRK